MPTSSFEKALQSARPDTIKTLFPNSKALLVSGQYIDRAMLVRQNAMCIAVNGRNSFIIAGALRAAQRANSTFIVEIARSEGGTNAYCPVNYWNIARITDAFCNQLGITVPVAIHADHFGIKKESDIDMARIEIPTLFEAGITSIAIDASHLPDVDNLRANIELNQYIPKWAGLETEVGEIKGTQGLSTSKEALFLIEGLNAHHIFPDWIALNNGTTHGIETDGQGIQVELTKEVHTALQPYATSGAQHGTSGNSMDRLRQIAQQTHTTKANVATALQMLSWGLKVNENGNAEIINGAFVKEPNEGITNELWAEMVAHAAKNNWSLGDYKKFNLLFDNKFQAQPHPIRERMIRRVEEFVYHLITEVFNSTDTADIALELMATSGEAMPAPKATHIADASEWTPVKARERAILLDGDKGPEGDFDD